MDQTIAYHRFHCVSPDVYLKSEVLPPMSYSSRKDIAKRVCLDLLKDSTSLFAQDYIDFMFNGKCTSEFKSIAGLVRVYSSDKIFFTEDSGIFVKLEV